MSVQSSGRAGRPNTHGVDGAHLRAGPPDNTLERTTPTPPLPRRAAAAVLLQLYGVAATPDEFIPFGGQGEARFMGGVAAKYGVASFDAEAATALFFDIYINRYCRGPAAAAIAFPGAVGFVRACRAAGLAAAVASSAARVKVDANLEAAGFDADADFGAVVSGASFARNKPAPDVFLAAAAGLGLAPAECVVLEDAPAGVQAARAAGMRCLAVTTTLSEEEMAREAPDAVFADISAISVDDVLAARYADGRDWRRQQQQWEREQQEQQRAAA